MLDLNNDVAFKLAVIGQEVIIAGAGPVGFGVFPIQMMVVDKAAVQNISVVGLQGTGQHIGSISWAPLVHRGSWTALGIGLDCKSTKVRDQSVDLINLVLPPLLHLRIERVKGIELTDDFRATQIDGQRQLDSIGAKGISNTRQLWQETGIKDFQIGIDVIHRTAIDSD